MYHTDRIDAKGENMDWTQALTIIAANFGGGLAMFLWLRSEANSDRREMRQEMNQFHEAIKDFHGKLCALEEKHRIK